MAHLEVNDVCLFKSTFIASISNNSMCYVVCLYSASILYRSTASRITVTWQPWTDYLSIKAHGAKILQTNITIECQLYPALLQELEKRLRAQSWFKVIGLPSEGGLALAADGSNRPCSLTRQLVHFETTWVPSASLQIILASLFPFTKT